jgi:hypothetical protein
MLRKSFDLVSPPTRDECVRRLQEKTESRFLAVFSNKPVAGHVGYTSFRIRKRIAYRNSFQPHVSGDLLNEGGRTRVRCRVGMHPAVIAFMAIWFGVLLIGGGAAAISAIGSLLRDHATAHAWTSVAAAAFMLSGGVAMVALGHFAGRNEPRFLIDFLRDTIAAQNA